MRGYAPVAYERSLPSLDRPAHDWLERVQAQVNARKADEPWTLVALPGEADSLVAVRHTLWWRLVTLVLNVPRRRLARRMRLAIDAQANMGASAARARRTQ